MEILQIKWSAKTMVLMTSCRELLQVKQSEHSRTANLPLLLLPCLYIVVRRRLSCCIALAARIDVGPEVQQTNCLGELPSSKGLPAAVLPSVTSRNPPLPSSSITQYLALNSSRSRRPAQSQNSTSWRALKTPGSLCSNIQPSKAHKCLYASCQPTRLTSN
jgi:hypothetical protein